MIVQEKSTGKIYKVVTSGSNGYALIDKFGKMDYPLFNQFENFYNEIDCRNSFTYDGIGIDGKTHCGTLFDHYTGMTHDCSGDTKRKLWSYINEYCEGEICEIDGQLFKF